MYGAEKDIRNENPLRICFFSKLNKYKARYKLEKKEGKNAPTIRVKTNGFVIVKANHLGKAPSKPSTFA